MNRMYVLWRRRDNVLGEIIKREVKQYSKQRAGVKSAH